MRSISRLFVILVLLLVLSNSKLYSQIGSDENEFVIVETPYFFEGEVKLNSNETIHGLISLNQKQNGEYTTAVKNGKSTQYFSNATLQCVVLFSKNKTISGTTKFEKLPHSEKFYRILKEGNTTIYDTSLKPFDGNLVGEIYVKEENTIRSIFNFWSSGPKQDLIDFLNKRDSKNFKRKDFKSTNVLLDYVSN